MMNEALLDVNLLIPSVVENHLFSISRDQTFLRCSRYSKPLAPDPHSKSLICSRKNQRANATNHFDLMEIDQQIERRVKQFHVPPVRIASFVGRRRLLPRLIADQASSFRGEIS